MESVLAYLGMHGVPLFCDRAKKRRKTICENLFNGFIDPGSENFTMEVSL